MAAVTSEAGQLGTKTKEEWHSIINESWEEGKTQPAEQTT